ncbi:hypothetical protein K505DRAFT_72916 [Melanomma pulvis-pyrius CBS 109.77]|uniref:Uncharacterized protein n=1 Tax=Melanomma pulvis-pyrius CBS 109.77 TaxID=1314802 RepID=A0A6A6X4H2_9PLEO|nr:hypothetical protein K505DRAFT_72916 [Melanomma pulvis-pyrius CBS 109.77]
MNWTSRPRPCTPQVALRYTLGTLKYPHAEINIPTVQNVGIRALYSTDFAPATAGAPQPDNGVTCGVQIVYLLLPDARLATLVRCLIRDAVRIAPPAQECCYWQNPRLGSAVCTCWKTDAVCAVICVHHVYVGYMPNCSCSAVAAPQTLNPSKICEQ